MPRSVPAVDCGTTRYYPARMKPPLPLSPRSGTVTVSVCIMGTSLLRPVQMLTQMIETRDGAELSVFCDSGSQVMMLTNRKATAAGLMPEPSSPCSSRSSRLRDCYWQKDTMSNQGRWKVHSVGLRSGRYSDRCQLQQGPRGWPSSSQVEWRTSRT
jgi:hypothetical protein